MQTFRTYCAFALLVAAAFAERSGAQVGAAQRAARVVTIGGFTEDSIRTWQLRSDSAAPSLLRSASSINPRIANDIGAPQRLHWAAVLPESRLTSNSALPFSLNDGALWAGRGTSYSVRAGFRAEWGPVRLVLLPEYINFANDSFPAPPSPPNPLPPPPRSPFSSPWHANGQSIDLPYRFGDRPIRQFSPGQSTLMLDVRGATVGASTENEWWGPGIRNALILSNNAPGFTHAFVRTNRPLTTRFGAFQGRWIAGWLRESDHFDTDPTNDLRSISLAAVTFTPRAEPGLELGVARSVFAPTPSRGRALRSAFQVFADVGRPNARPYLDSTLAPGRDQLISFFFRWVFPKDGFETYAEWARTEIPRSIRDFLLYPNHTQGYTLGLQWLGDSLVGGGRLRVQSEFTYLEQSTTYRFRDIGSWYTSRAVVQGYTNRGQTLGATIGPGSSSQFVALDYVAPYWQLGAYLNRIRWLEDAHSQQVYPMVGPNTYGWCEHDVSLLPGIRGAAHTKFGDVSVDYSSGWRLNVFFVNAGPCPISPGWDQRNRSLTVRVTPVWF